jgi:class 3 adenylate cyclase
MRPGGSCLPHTSAADCLPMPPRRERVLVTVLFTDIVGSTQIAAELGDRRWRDLVQRHHALVRRELKRSGGRELDTAGDGFFARFDRPATAIRCACAISDAVRDLGIEIRAGLHLGEAEVVDGKVGGIGVNVGARVMGVGEGGEVLVSSTLRDAVAGSGFDFADHGVHELKGIEGEWRLFEVTAIDGVRRSLPLPPEEARERRGFVEATPTGRRRDVVAASAVVVVVLALAGAFATGTLGGDGRDPNASTGPTRAERDLLTLVPNAFRDTCTIGSPPTGTLATVSCAPTEAYAVTYSSFASSDMLATTFDGFASPADLTNVDCARAPSARGEYSVNGVPVGEVACYTIAGTSISTTGSVIAWTDRDHLVVGRAIRGDAADQTLYEWWRREAGPWVSATAHPPKDGDAAPVIEGVFESTPGWTLTFVEGRYVDSAFVYPGEAEPLYAKPSTLLIYHRQPPPTFGGELCPNYEEYRWRLDGDRLDLDLRSGGCPEYSSEEIGGAHWRRID